MAVENGENTTHLLYSVSSKAIYYTRSVPCECPKPHLTVKMSSYTFSVSLTAQLRLLSAWSWSWNTFSSGFQFCEVFV